MTDILSMEHQIDVVPISQALKWYIIWLKWGMIELKFIEIESKSFLWIWYSPRFESGSKSGTKYPWIQTKSEKKSEFRLTDHLIRIRRICKRICFKFVPADHLLNFESKDLSLDSKITFGYATGKRLITLKNQDWLGSEFIPKITRNKISYPLSPFFTLNSHGTSWQ